jgi:hypothetical protein
MTRVASLQAQTRIDFSGLLLAGSSNIDGRREDNNRECDHYGRVRKPAAVMNLLPSLCLVSYTEKKEAAHAVGAGKTGAPLQATFVGFS